jgi:hypothetical protein
MNSGEKQKSHIVALQKISILEKIFLNRNSKTSTKKKQGTLKVGY